MTTATPRRSPTNKSPLARKPGVREQAAQETRDAILKAATKIFAKNGFAGGRIDEISKAAKSYDRMIYYYFGSKEDLFIAVLEEMYKRFNEAELALELSSDQPVESLTAVISFMWTFYQRNPEFITLLNDENLHRGKHISKIAAGARVFIARHPDHRAAAGERCAQEGVSCRSFGARRLPDDCCDELLLHFQPPHTVGFPGREAGESRSTDPLAGVRRRSGDADGQALDLSSRT
jgi:AcrR family transcriptional regulator